MTPQTPGEKLVNLEARMKTLEKTMVEVLTFQDNFRNFVTDHNATERERDRVRDAQHKENQEKTARTNNRLVFYGTIIALFSLIAAICMVILTVRSFQNPKSNPAQYFHSSASSEVYADSNNHALIPDLR